MQPELGWHPVALSRDIEPGTAAGTRLSGRELVVWRDGSGTVHVFDDRCPHRGMRLSFGFVRGDRLACLYHGWQYDGEGRCRHIPAHPALDVPETIRVPALAVAERAGIVWIAEEDGGAPPEDRPAVPVRSLYLDLDATVVADALIGGPGERCERIGAQFFAMEAEGTSLLLALQDIAPGRAALHIVAKDEAGGLLSFALALRDRIEGAAEAVP